MSFTDNVKLAIDVAKLDRKAISKVAKDKKSLWPAVIIMIIGGALSALIGLFTGQPNAALGILTAAILAPIAAIVWVGILWLFAKVFGGKAKYSDFYRAMGHGQIVGWLSFIPVINFLAAIWGIIVSVVIISEVHGMTIGKAFLAWIVPLVIIIVLVTFVFTTLLAGLGLFLGASALTSLVA